MCAGTQIYVIIIIPIIIDEHRANHKFITFNKNKKPNGIFYFFRYFK